MIEKIYQLYTNNPVISTDTRNIIKNSIFFALKGDSFNGNKFAGEALEKGCAYAIIDEKEYKKDNRCILVENVLQTLQNLAKHHRKQLNIPIIGITGTNGKTTTKELIRTVLSKKYKTFATAGNFNNHIGVPLSILSINKEIEMAVIEMGANHPGEIKELCQISDPDYGIITNIGKAHLEGFGSFEGVINTKKELYDHLSKKNGNIFINTDNEILNKISNSLNKITYGSSINNDIIGEQINSDTYISFRWKSKNNNAKLNDKEFITTQIIGAYNFENILAAVCIGNYFNVDEKHINDAISSYKSDNNRSQLINSSNTIILDAYNANPTSMTASISSFMDINCKTKYFILGDMLELGEYSEDEHKKIIRLLKDNNVKNAVLIGNNFHKLKNNDFIFFNNVDECKAWLINNPIEKACILIKGSRGIKLEKLTEVL